MIVRKMEGSIEKHNRDVIGYVLALLKGCGEFDSKHDNKMKTVSNILNSIYEDLSSQKDVVRAEHDNKTCK